MVSTVELLASSARTSSTNSGELRDDFSWADHLRAQLDVTAASGTSPTLDVTLEDTLDGTNWNTVGTFTQKTAASRQVVNVAAPISGRLRVKWVVGGTDTPTFTFSVKAVAKG